MTHAPPRVFRPVDGALLDLDSLTSISQARDAALSAWLELAWPGTQGLVLQGLQPFAPLANAELARNAPPGTIKVDLSSSAVRVSPGRALIMDREGSCHVLVVEDATSVPWPVRDGRPDPQTDKVLALVADIGKRNSSAGVMVASRALSHRITFIDRGQLRAHPRVIPLATRMARQPELWATDLRRIWGPQHRPVKHALKLLEVIEAKLWQDPPRGSMWSRRVHDDDPVRYVLMAAATLQAARLALATRRMTSLERAELLRTLHEEFKRYMGPTVSQMLLTLFGDAVDGSPYGFNTAADEGR